MNRLVLVILISLTMLPGSLANGQDLPDQATVSGVIGHGQRHNLSCEARSASDWAAFFGYSVSEDELLNIMPRSDNPNNGFVGSPDGVWGNIPPYAYGVYPPPLAAALRAEGVPAREASGLIWDDLRSEIAVGRPVIIWIIGAMWSGAPQDYTASDGQTVRVAAFEHSMILTGYTRNTVDVVDAYTGLSYVYSLQAFLQSWEVLGRLALIYDTPPPAPVATMTPLLPPTETPTPTQTPLPTFTPTPPDRVTVRASDTLVGLAQRFNVSWEALVASARLKYPYFIYPGDVLKLPPGAREVLPFISTPTATQIPPTATPTVMPTPAPLPSPTVVEIYVVKRGDFIIDLAQRFGVDWRTLIEINHLSYPWTIYPGQVLKIRS
jgi:LysM repeat protein